MNGGSDASQNGTIPSFGLRLHGRSGGSVHCCRICNIAAEVTVARLLAGTAVEQTIAGIIVVEHRNN